MGIQLRKAGITSFTIFERADEIGGTWRDNTYPGAACDVPSHVYSYSFEQNPEWSRTFSSSAEIQQYLLRCVEKYGLRPHLRLEIAIADASFDEARGLWRLTTGAGDTVTARVVVSGVGGLTEPAYPDIEGLDEFRGELMHTARWNHDYDLAGKRVAVVGTGASAVQVVPSIAPEVGKLTVVQRTPAWVVPKRDRKISERMKRVFRRWPLAMKLLRSMLFWLSELMGPVLILDSPRLSRIGERASEKHLDACISDPALREKLRPDFQFGCKRMLVSDDFWPTLERDNVELVTEAVTALRADAVVTADGREHPVDAIVFATGFEVGISSAPFRVRGLGGKSLDEAWSDGAVAYKGVAVSGFPNWFIIMGPNTGPGHTSVLIYTEAQIAYIVQGIKRLMSDGIKYLHVKQDVQDSYNDRLQRRMKHTVWTSGCKSWYLSDDGKNRTLYPGFATEYCARIRRFKAAEYEAVYLSDESMQSDREFASLELSEPPLTRAG